MSTLSARVCSAAAPGGRSSRLAALLCLLPLAVLLVYASRARAAEPHDRMQVDGSYYGAASGRNGNYTQVGLQLWQRGRHLDGRIDWSGTYTQVHLQGSCSPGGKIRLVGHSWTPDGRLTIRVEGRHHREEDGQSMWITGTYRLSGPVGERGSLDIGGYDNRDPRDTGDS
jgi:hypothetical protein